MISIDINGISPFAKEGVPEKLFSESISQLSILRDGKGQGNDFLGWLTLPDEIENQLPAIKACAERLKNQAQITVVIGIGGSYLGSKGTY